MNKENIKKQKKGSQFLAMLCFVLIGAACGFLLITYFNSISASDLSFGKFLFMLCFMLVWLYVTIFLQIIIHEAGHFVFGLLTGYRFSSFRIGNLMWVKENDKIKFRRMSLAGTGGQCLMCPPDMTEGKIPFALYNLGGSIMNLIAALLFMGSYFLCRNIPYLATLFLITTVISVGFAITNGFPMRLGMIDNDGYNAKSLGKSPAALRSFWVQMKVAEQLTKGVRLKDMPEEWFYLPDKNGLQNSMTAVMAVFYENRLMDMHRFEEAAELIDKLETMDTEMVGIYNCLLSCDRLYCELIREKNPEVVEKLRTKEQVKLMKQMRKFPTVIRTEYVYALHYEKDQAKAQRLKTQFEKCAKTHPYASDIESERELIQIAEDKEKNAYKV